MMTAPSPSSRPIRIGPAVRKPISLRRTIMSHHWNRIDGTTRSRWSTANHATAGGRTGFEQASNPAPDRRRH
jgi:hypothetical protein